MKTENQNQTIVAFHVGRGGRYWNPGHVSFIGEKKISEFVVKDGKVFTIAGRTLTVYHLDPIPFRKNN